MALLVHVDGHAELCCALAAARLGVSVVRVGGKPHNGAGRVIARLADLLLSRSPLDDVAPRTPMTPERVFAIGNPLVELVQRYADAALDEAAWQDLGVDPGNYVLGILTGAAPFGALEAWRHDLEERFPLVLEAPSDYSVAGARLVSAASFVKRLSLERGAKAIFTDSTRVCEEAAVLGVPCQALTGHAAGEPPALTVDGSRWDRQACRRAADAVVANLARVRLRS